MPFRRELGELRNYLALSTESEAEKAFTTYKNYLVHIRNCLSGTYGTGPSLVPSLVGDVRGTKKFRSINRRRLSPDQHRALAGALTISWAKELQLRLPGAFDPGLLPHLIQGSGPLAYYAVFHGARALFLAGGGRSSLRPTPRPWRLWAAGSGTASCSVHPGPCTAWAARTMPR